MYAYTWKLKQSPHQLALPCQDGTKQSMQLCHFSPHKRSISNEEVNTPLYRAKQRWWLKSPLGLSVYPTNIDRTQQTWIGGLAGLKRRKWQPFQNVHQNTKLLVLTMLNSCQLHSSVGKESTLTVLKKTNTQKSNHVIKGSCRPK